MKEFTFAKIDTREGVANALAILNILFRVIPLTMAAVGDIHNIAGVRVLPVNIKRSNVSMDLFDRLLDCGMNPNRATHNAKPVFVAIDSFQYDALYSLCAHGADVINRYDVPEHTDDVPFEMNIYGIVDLTPVEFATRSLRRIMDDVNQMRAAGRRNTDPSVHALLLTADVLKRMILLLKSTVRNAIIKLTGADAEDELSVDSVPDADMRQLFTNSTEMKRVFLN